MRFFSMMLVLVFMLIFSSQAEARCRGGFLRGRLVQQGSCATQQLFMPPAVVAGTRTFKGCVGGSCFR